MRTRCAHLCSDLKLRISFRTRMIYGGRNWPLNIGKQLHLHNPTTCVHTSTSDTSHTVDLKSLTSVNCSCLPAPAYPVIATAIASAPLIFD